MIEVEFNDSNHDHEQQETHEQQRQRVGFKDHGTKHNQVRGLGSEVSSIVTVQFVQMGGTTVIKVEIQ